MATVEAAYRVKKKEEESAYSSILKQKISPNPSNRITEQLLRPGYITIGKNGISIFKKDPANTPDSVIKMTPEKTADAFGGAMGLLAESNRIKSAKKA